MSNDDIVLDASAILAYLLNEPGAKGILLLLERAVMSTVNLAEVRTRLIDRGGTALASGERVLQLMRRVEPFNEGDAVVAAELRRTTSHAGLSLGDRACLALALRLDAEVYTADQAWNRVNVGCLIHMVR